MRPEVGPGIPLLDTSCVPVWANPATATVPCRSLIASLGLCCSQFIVITARMLSLRRTVQLPWSFHRIISVSQTGPCVSSVKRKEPVHPMHRVGFPHGFLFQNNILSCFLLFLYGLWHQFFCLLVGWVVNSCINPGIFLQGVPAHVPGAAHTPGRQQGTGLSLGQSLVSWVGAFLGDSAVTESRAWWENENMEPYSTFKTENVAYQRKNWGTLMWRKGKYLSQKKVMPGNNGSAVSYTRV